MRLRIHQTDHAIIRADARRFFEMVRADFGDWQPLFLRAPEPAQKTYRIFTRGKPIRALAKVAEIGHVHFAVKALEKLRPNLRMARPTVTLIRNSLNG